MIDELMRQIEEDLVRGVLKSAFNCTVPQSPGRDISASIYEACERLAKYRPVYGVACCPLVERLIREQNPESGRCMFGSSPAILIDPRLSVDKNEVYYDLVEWSLRCAEQQVWDSNIRQGRKAAALL